MNSLIRTLLSLTLVGLVSLSGYAPAEASAIKFKSCSSLNKKFSGGIARHPQLVFDAAELFHQPIFKLKIYKSNRKLDFDNDGIVCEVTVADVAHAQILEQLKKSPAVEQSLLIIRSGPSVASSDLAIVKKSVLTAMKLFGNSVPLERVNATWFTSADVDWVDSAIAEAGAFPKNYSANLRNFSSQCNMGNAGVGDNGPYLNQCLGPSGAPPSHKSETAAHEYFHTLQYSNMGGQALPLWFLEGGATFVGIHAGGHSFGDFRTARNLTLGRYASRGLDRVAQEAVANSNLEAIVNRLIALQNTNPEQPIRSSAYVFGMLLTEKMVADFGYSQWEDFLKTIGTRGFDQAFTETYKIPIRNYYLKSAAYIVSQLKVSR